MSCPSTARATQPPGDATETKATEALGMTLQTFDKTWATKLHITDIKGECSHIENRPRLSRGQVGTTG